MKSGPPHRYEDLCRVYLPQASINWYTFISSTIRELYQELGLMHDREQRPSEFGLKVREHPGAMIITAKNKMGAADSEVRSQDLWGQVQRRFRFRKPNDDNKHNLRFTQEFIKKLGGDGSSKAEGSAARIFRDVSYDDIIKYIDTMRLPEDDLGNRALIKHLRSMKNAELGLPRVVLFNLSNSSKPPWQSKLTDRESAFIDKPFSFSKKIELTLPKRLMDAAPDEYRVRSVHLGSSDDEKLFLSETERKKVVEMVRPKKAVSFDYLCSEERNYPGLIIYLFAVAVREGDEGGCKLGHGLMPTVGFTVSLPRAGKNLKGKTSKEIKAIVKQTKHSYQVNKVHSRLQELCSYEDYEDDE